MNVYFAIIAAFLVFLWIFAFLGCETGDDEDFLIESALRSKIEYSEKNSGFYKDNVVLKESGEVYFGVKNPFYSDVSVLVFPRCLDSEGNEEKIIDRQFVNVGPRKLQVFKIPLRHPEKEDYYFCNVAVQIKDLEERLLLVVETKNA